MIKNLLKNKKGSALPMVIIIITILSTLGVAVMSLSLAHYKLGMLDKKAKLSFYMAESGLEQAYKIMLEEVGEAIKVGNNKVNEAIHEWLLEQVESMENDPEDVDVEIISKYIHDYHYVFGSGIEEGYYVLDVNWENIKKAMLSESEEDNWYKDTKIDLQEKFKEGYKEYFNTKEDGEYVFVSKITTAAKYENIFAEESEKVPEISVLNPPEPLFGGDEASITLCSKYEKDEVPQKVQMTFTIQIPEDALKNFYVYQKVLKTNKVNPLWDYALTACEDIVISAADVKIAGDVYVYGSAEQGGFKLLGDSTNVKVSGDIITGSNVMIEDGEDSKLEIGGTVFAKNLIIDGYEKNSIEIKEDVYTSDDIRINGRKSVLKVLGSFFGFSDGSDKSEPDQSSSIIIHTSDINVEANEEEDKKGSELSIEGDVYILGTSYVKTEKEPYQTGESLSIIGNYRAYNYYYPGYGYEYYDPMHLVTTNPEGKTMSATDKAVFFKTFYEDENKENLKWEMLTGKGNIRLGVEENDIYTLGAYFNRGEFYRKGAKEFSVGSVEDFSKNCKETYSEKVNLFVDKNDEPCLNKYVSFTGPESGYIVFTNQDVYLVGDNGTPEDSSGKVINLPDSICQGIIVSSGDVYLSGKINFRGLIAAQGKIYIKDEHPKIIKGDRFYVRNKIMEWEDNDPFSVGYPEDSVSETIESGMGVTEPTSVIPYKRYITIDMWEKV